MVVKGGGGVRRFVHFSLHLYDLNFGRYFAWAYFQTTLHSGSCSPITLEAAVLPVPISYLCLGDEVLTQLFEPIVF